MEEKPQRLCASCQPALLMLEAPLLVVVVVVLVLVLLHGVGGGVVLLVMQTVGVFLAW